MGVSVVGERDYCMLKDLNLEIKGLSDDDDADGTFSLCLWLYLTNYAPSAPSILLHQVHPDITHIVPFLVLTERKTMMIFPLLFLHQEAPSKGNFSSWTEVPHASSKVEVPLNKWVHVGCEITMYFMRLYIDGKVVGEKLLSSSITNNSHSYSWRKISLTSSIGDDDGLHGYVHSVEFLPLTSSSIKNHYIKDPPLLLSIDSASASEIKEESDGVWSIVGGKESCRRNFSLDVILLDAFGQPVNKEMEVVASLLYADNEAPVEKPDDAESPLLTNYDGIEYASCDRPSKLINGLASFKLKISQLSSKCDNRLFCIKFCIPKMRRYPFLEAFSIPIRSVSRGRNGRTSSLVSKKSPPAIHLVTGYQSSGLDDGSSGLLRNIVREAKPSPLSKRVKLGQEKPYVTCMADLTLERAEEECNSQALASTTKDDNIYGARMDGRPDNLEETNNSSDSESIEATNSVFSAPSDRSPVSDLTVFKYCLGGLNEKSLLLKEIAISVSEQELADFAQQVALYSGCSHHRCQILITKRLIEEGIKVWNCLSQNNHHVLWVNLVWEITEHFMKIAQCSTRSLTHQDFELLRRIAGCQELVSRENFEKMWCWLYPVAFTLSQDYINTMWTSASPKWIEGLITKEDAESSLQGSGGLQDPGTFVLRFPTSRSWPHPDAGNLIVTYVGSDYNIHHRMLSLDFIYSSGSKEMTVKPLQDMLLEEPELSRLGRIIRSV